MKLSGATVHCIADMSHWCISWVGRSKGVARIYNNDLEWPAENAENESSNTSRVGMESGVITVWDMGIIMSCVNGVWDRAPAENGFDAFLGFENRFWEQRIVWM